MATPTEWFIAIVSSGVVTAFTNYFIQRFLIKPMDKKINELQLSTIQKLATKVDEFTEIEKQLLKEKRT
jgi:hypothetical protein